MEEQVNIPQKFNKQKKSQICRFYQRGLCMLKSSECYFSHGVWDLHYQKYKQGQHIIYDHSKVPKEQKYEILMKGPRNYINLYEYQKEKIFTQAELNQDSSKRKIIRNQMHMQMFNDFMDLLQCYYPQANFTEQFLIRQYSRVGFNKIMACIKLNHITSYICDPPSSRFYLLPVKMPPFQNKQINYIIPLIPDQQIQQFYKQQYLSYIQQLKTINKKQNINNNNNQQFLNQNSIKKHMFSLTRPSLPIMPLNMFLKRKKMSFNTFLKVITSDGDNNQNIVQLNQQLKQEQLLKLSNLYIDKSIQQQGYCSWNDVYKYLGTQHKINNANITNPIKPKLLQQGYYFLNFPMFQMITSQQKLNNWHQCLRTCECQYNKIYPIQQLLLQQLTIQQQQQNYNIFPQKQSLDIYNVDTLLKCAPILLASKIIGVDLQGRLRKGGYIQMIQINTGRNTFLIDIYRMLMINNDMQAYQLCKKIMRNVMCDEKIFKIFHDCRHDSLVLHQVMNTCVVNIFDTSAVETFRGQLQIYQQMRKNMNNNNQMMNNNNNNNNNNEKQAKTILKTITNVKTSGLNQILTKYHAPHGINKNKQWFHQLWKKGQTQLFLTRPLDPEYRQYCIKDVLDLLHVCQEMSVGVCRNFVRWLSSFYVKQGYIMTLDQK